MKPATDEQVVAEMRKLAQHRGVAYGSQLRYEALARILERTPADLRAERRRAEAPKEPDA